MRDLCEATKEASVICVNVLHPLSPQPSLFLHGLLLSLSCFSIK